MRTSRSFASEALSCLVVVGLVAATLVWVAAQRFASRTLPDTSPVATRPALARTLGLVVLDGLREDRFRSLMPETLAIAEARGTVCSVEGPALSFTLSGVYGLGTGDVATLAQIPSNFESRPANVDSLPASLARQGGRTCLFGERLWADLFGAFAVADDTTRDNGPFERHAATAIDAFSDGVKLGGCNLAVFHDAEFDGLGHRHGIYADAYVGYVRSVDGRLRKLVEEAGPEVTWFVTSDHGMLDSGGHGGPQPEARASFLAAWGPGVRRGPCAARVDQSDVPTTAAVLLGAAIPWQSRGVVADMVDVTPAARASLDRELLEQKRNLASKLDETYGRGPSKVELSLDECRHLIDDLQRPSSGWRVLAGLVPLVAAIAALVARGRVTRRTLLRRTMLLPMGAFLAFGWGFATFVYPTRSYGTSALVEWTFVGGALLGAALLARQARIAPTWVMGILLAAVVSMETHWIAHLQPVVIGWLAWLASGAARRSTKWALALLAGAGSFAVIELAWTDSISTRQPSGPFATLAVVALTGWFGALALSKTWPLGMKRRNGKALTAAYVFAATYCLALAAPVTVRLWVPVAALCVCIFESRWIQELSMVDAIVAGFLAFFALQMTPTTWGVLILASSMSFAWLDSPHVDRALGPRAAAWARGAGLLATAYTFTVVEGNRFVFADINVLTGFVGGSVKLHLPLTVTFISIYYASPLIVTIGLWLRLSRHRPHVVRAIRTAAALASIRLAYLVGNIVWGRLAEGSWSKQLSEAALLAAWIPALLILLVASAYPAPPAAEIVAARVPA